MYKKLTNVHSELANLREKGLQKGAEVGWGWHLFPYTVKLGSTTYIGAAPTSGKTEFWFEILINLSCLHGWKHIIFSPETGDPQEIFAELCHKLIGKPYYGFDKMSDADKTYAEMFIDEHFVIIDPQDEDLTIEMFYKKVDEIENELGISFQTTTIDPWNELTEKYLPEDLGREDKYLSRILGFVRKNARKTNRHNCVITHVRDQTIINQNGMTYYPMPHARELAGGQVWYRKGMSMIILWRPPKGVADANGRVYLNNELVVKIAKTKPKGTSKNGEYLLTYDYEKGRYYIDYQSKQVYSNRGSFEKQEVKEQTVAEKPIETIKPNLLFDEEKPQLEDAEEKKHQEILTTYLKPKINKNPDFLEFKENWE